MLFFFSDLTSWFNIVQLSYHFHFFLLLKYSLDIARGTALRSSLKFGWFRRQHGGKWKFNVNAYLTSPGSVSSVVINSVACPRYARNDMLEHLSHSSSNLICHCFEIKFIVKIKYFSSIEVHLEWYIIAKNSQSSLGKINNFYNRKNFLF